MNKAELIDIVAAKASTSKAATTVVVAAAIEAISDALAKGENVQFISWHFQHAGTPGPHRRDPQTGKEMKIPAKKVVRFKPGAASSAAANAPARRRSNCFRLAWPPP